MPMFSAPLTGLLLCGAAASTASPTFTKIQIDSVFRSEGVSVADVNHDGKLDILVGDLWYEAPDWKPHAIRKVGHYNGQTGYSDAFYSFAWDINGDGWVDEIVIGLPNTPCYWYENPKGGDGPWKEHLIAEHACNESPWFGDLLGDGKRELIFARQDHHLMQWFEPGPDVTAPWIAHDISLPGGKGTDMYSHGLGVGDVNGDGRLDVLVKDGWYEAPADRRSSPWTFHPCHLGVDCVQMYVYDVLGNGGRDVITSSAHHYGLWWHEQKPDGTFVQHLIDDKVSETHALELADLDGSGVPAIITGKRWFAHNGNGSDPGDHEPAILEYFTMARANGQVTFTKHIIDDDSGVGMNIVVADMFGRGKQDIVISNKKGVFLFKQN